MDTGGGRRHLVYPRADQRHDIGLPIAIERAGPDLAEHPQIRDSRARQNLNLSPGPAHILDG
jgi:hypothetical protein